MGCCIGRCCQPRRSRRPKKTIDRDESTDAESDINSEVFGEYSGMRSRSFHASKTYSEASSIYYTGNRNLSDVASRRWRSSSTPNVILLSTESRYSHTEEQETYNRLQSVFSKFFRNDQQRSVIEDYPNCPFIRTAGIFDVSSTHNGHPYLQHILSAVGETNIPGNLQTIIRESDFESDDVASTLSGIVTKLKPRCNVMSSGEAKTIREELINVVNGTLLNLRDIKTNTDVFKGVNAVLLGSAAERTKVSHPDEWDFVIFMPYFWEKNKSAFPVDQNSNAILIGSSYNSEKLVLECVLKKYEREEGDPDHYYYFGDILKRIFVKAFRSLLEGTRFSFKSVCFNHQAAVALTLTRGGLDIKIDLSFGIRDEGNVSSLHNSMLVRPVCEQPPFGFHILWKDSTNPTSTFEEVRYMQNLSNNIKLCFQLCKCLIEQFTPPTYKPCECRQSVFPSHRLKLILFYICKYYDDERFWRKTQFPNRILEMFLTYSLCLRFGTVNNVLSMIQRGQYADVGQYIYSANLDVIPIHVKNTFLPKDLEQCAKTLDLFTANGSVIENYLSAFKNYPGSERRKYDADISDAFCEFLYCLKRSQLSTEDSAVTMPKPCGTEEFLDTRVEQNHTEENAETKVLREQWILTVEGIVTAMIVAPDHDGELLVTTKELVGNRESRLLKIKYNQVIQEITLLCMSYDMCYYNGVISIATQNNMYRLYAYTDLSELSSFATPQHDQCISLTRLDDGYVMCFNNDKQIWKTNTTGQTLYSSKNTFVSPSRVTAIKNESAVAVLDRTRVVVLSRDLESILFVYAPKRSFNPTDLCWNSENSSLFVCESDRISAITGDWGFITELTTRYPDTRTLICHDPHHHTLLCLIRRSEYMSKILVYRC